MGLQVHSSGFVFSFGLVLPGLVWFGFRGSWVAGRVDGLFLVIDCFSGFMVYCLLGFPSLVDCVLFIFRWFKLLWYWFLRAFVGVIALLLDW